MQTTTTPQEMAPQKPPLWFWLVIILALLFSLMGLGQLLFLSASPDPLWTLATYAVGQLANFAGAISLALRRRIASWFYLLMAAAFIVHRVWLLLFSGLWPELPPGKPFAQLIVVLIAFLLFFFARFGVRRNWLQ